MAERRMTLMEQEERIRLEQERLMKLEEERLVRMEEERRHEFEEMAEKNQSIQYVHFERYPTRKFLVDLLEYFRKHQNFEDIVGFPTDHDDDTRWNSGFSPNVGKAVLAAGNLFYLYRDADACHKCPVLLAMQKAHEDEESPMELIDFRNILSKIYYPFHTLAYICEYYVRHRMKTPNFRTELWMQVTLLKRYSRFFETNNDRPTMLHKGHFVALDSCAKEFLETLVETRRCQCYLRLPTEKFLTNLFEYYATQRFPKPKRDASGLENHGFTREIGEAVTQTWHMRLGFQFFYDPEGLVALPKSARPRPTPKDPEHYTLSGLSGCLTRIMLERRHRECLFEFLALASQRHLETRVREEDAGMAPAVRRAAATLLERMVRENYQVPASRQPACRDCEAEGEVLLQKDYKDMHARARAYLRTIDKVKQCLCLERAVTPEFFYDLLEFFQDHRGCHHRLAREDGKYRGHFVGRTWLSKFTADIGEAVLMSFRYLSRKHRWMDERMNREVAFARRLPLPVSEVERDSRFSWMSPEDYLSACVLNMADPMLEDTFETSPFRFYAVACKYCTACEVAGAELADRLIDCVLNVCAVWTERFLETYFQEERQVPCHVCRARGLLLQYKDLSTLDVMAEDYIGAILYFKEEDERREAEARRRYIEKLREAEENGTTVSDVVAVEIPEESDAAAKGTTLKIVDYEY